MAPAADPSGCRPPPPRTGRWPAGPGQARPARHGSVAGRARSTVPARPRHELSRCARRRPDHAPSTRRLNGLGPRRGRHLPHIRRHTPTLPKNPPINMRTLAAHAANPLAKGRLTLRTSNVSQLRSMWASMTIGFRLLASRMRSSRTPCTCPARRASGGATLDTAADRFGTPYIQEALDHQRPATQPPSSPAPWRCRCQYLLVRWPLPALRAAWSK